MFSFALKFNAIAYEKSSQYLFDIPGFTPMKHFQIVPCDLVLLLSLLNVCHDFPEFI